MNGKKSRHLALGFPGFHHFEGFFLLLRGQPSRATSDSSLFPGGGKSGSGSLTQDGPFKLGEARRHQNRSPLKFSGSI
jgi:hypothetical protein